MNGITLFFVIVGITAATAQLFKLIDAIEAPAKRGPRK